MCIIILTYLSLQINIPDSVTRRFDHSMSTYYISRSKIWVIVTGGYNEYNLSNDIFQTIAGSNMLVIIELGMIINILFIM